MAFQKVVDTAQISVIYTYNGEPAQNVFYAEHAGGYLLADLVALADQIDANVGLTWLPDQPAQASYVRTEVRGLAVENDLLVINNDTAGSGGDAGEALPGNVTFSIKKSSPFTGRSARGRTFWIGIPRSRLEVADRNELTALYVSEIVANVDLIRSQTNIVPGWQAVLVSRFTEGAKRSEGVTFDWVSSSAVDLVVDTNRGRLS